MISRVRKPLQYIVYLCSKSHVSHAEMVVVVFTPYGNQRQFNLHSNNINDSNNNCYISNTHKKKT